MGKAKYFTYRCKKYVLQCFVLKPICAILFIIFTPFQKQYPAFYVSSWLAASAPAPATFDCAVYLKQTKKENKTKNERKKRKQKTFQPHSEDEHCNI